MQENQTKITTKTITTEPSKRNLLTQTLKTERKSTQNEDSQTVSLLHSKRQSPQIEQEPEQKEVEMRPLVKIQRQRTTRKQSDQKTRNDAFAEAVADSDEEKK